MATNAFFLPALGFLLAVAFAAVAFAIFSATIANALGLPPDTSFFFLFFGDVDDGDDEDGSAKQKNFQTNKIINSINISTTKEIKQNKLNLYQQTCFRLISSTVRHNRH